MIDKETLKDKVPHGTVMFPLRIWTHEFEKYGHLCNYHWHDEAEFVCVKKGSCVFQVETDYVTIEKGQGLFINSGILHSDYSLEYPYSSFSIVFHMSMLSSAIPDVCTTKYLTPLLQNQGKAFYLIKGELDWEKRVLGHLEKIVQVCNDKDNGYELFTKSYLFSIFAELVSNGFLLQEQSRQEARDQVKIEKLKKVLTYICGHYQRKITIKDMADRINMSPYHFIRFFKSLTGKTPIEYLNQYRIHQAARLLQNGNRRILDVALEVGFENISYFIRTFKKYTRNTPSEYQNQLKNKGLGK